MTKAQRLISELKSHADPDRARSSQRYFKTEKGSYGEGDIFLGLTVPLQREIARKYPDLSLADIQKLLSSPIHEFRLTGLFVLNIIYAKASADEKEKIVKFYLKNTKHVNNWDLVDSSAPNILGSFLLDRPRDILYKLAKSKSLWEKRISIIAAYAFIKNNDFKDALRLSEILLADKHDLIHKAVGWMLREIGNRDVRVLDKFLNKHCTIMPRTMLRYSIEKMPEAKRKGYLKR